MRITYKRQGGFTLFEVLVVVTLLTLVLGFTLPRFHALLQPDSTDKLSRWIMIKTRDLRQRAMADQLTYVLHISPEEGRLWITEAHPDLTVDGDPNEAVETPAEIDAIQVPDEVTIEDVLFPLKDPVVAGKTKIRFFPQGYADRAIIRFVTHQDQQVSFLIETFLMDVIRYSRHVDFQSF